MSSDSPSFVTLSPNLFLTMTPTTRWTVILRLWISFLISLRVAEGLSVGFEIDSQLLPVAYANKRFEANLAPDTFVDFNGNLNYKVSGLPDWLSLNPKTLEISGIAPDSSSDSSTPFSIVATDSNGGGASSDGTILLKAASARRPVTANTTIVTHTLASAGALANGTSVVVSPGESFRIQFPPDIFMNTSESATYKGLSGDHSPLPIWVNFDAKTLTFSGEGPMVNSQVAPAQLFNLALVLSEDAGYANAEVPFSIVVGAHQFTTNVTVDTVTLSGKDSNVEPSSYKIPVSDMMLDGKPLVESQISKITANLTNYMHMDRDSLTLHIAPTPQDKSTNILITVYDPYDDFVQFNLAIDVPVLKQVSPTTRHSHSSSSSSSPTSSRMASTMSTRISTEAATKTSDSATTVIPVVSTTPTAASSKKSETVKIACGVTIPVAAVVAAIFLFFCCWRKRGKKNHPFGLQNKGTASTPSFNTCDYVPGAMIVQRTRSRRSNNSASTITSPFTGQGKMDLLPTQRVYTPTSLYSTDRTPIGTPMESYDTPQRASTFNFMRLDDEDGSYYGDVVNDTNHSSDNQSSLNHPRNSWRHPQPTDRWQDHQPLASMATIQPNEYVTLKRVDSHQTRSSMSNAPKTHSIKASDDSGNVQSLGSRSTASSVYDDRRDVSGISERSEIDRRLYPTHGQAF